MGKPINPACNRRCTYNYLQSRRKFSKQYATTSVIGNRTITKYFNLVNSRQQVTQNQILTKFIPHTFARSIKQDQKREEWEEIIEHWDHSRPPSHYWCPSNGHQLARSGIFYIMDPRDSLIPMRPQKESLIREAQKIKTFDYDLLQRDQPNPSEDSCFWLSWLKSLHMTSY